MATKTNGEQRVMVTCFIVPRKPVRVVCTKNHKLGHKCKRPHEVPASVIWQGQWPKDELGDLQSDVKYQRRCHHNSYSRWKTRWRNLSRVNPAPAFAAYLESQKANHLKEKPEFVFVPRR